MPLPEMEEATVGAAIGGQLPQHPALMTADLKLAMLLGVKPLLADTLPDRVPDEGVCPHVLKHT